MRSQAEKDQASKDKTPSKPKDRQYSGWDALGTEGTGGYMCPQHLPLLPGDTN